MFKKARKFGTNVSKGLKGIKITKLPIKKRKGEFSPDDIDKRIIRVLVSNPRASLREISATINNSVGTVRDHLHKLHKHNVIKGYTTIIDPKKFGYNITAIIKIFEKREDIGFIESKIGRLPNVFALYSVTGDTDAVILARFHDSQQLHDFIKKILRMRNVVRTETMIVLDTYKEDLSFTV